MASERSVRGSSRAFDCKKEYREFYLPKNKLQIVTLQPRDDFQRQEGVDGFGDSPVDEHLVVGIKAPGACPVCKHPQSHFEVCRENF